MSSKKLPSVQAGNKGRGNKRKSDGSKNANPDVAIEFDSVVRQNNPHPREVCRVFMASLSLVNGGNLKIEELASTYRFGGDPQKLVL